MERKNGENVKKYGKMSSKLFYPSISLTKKKKNAVSCSLKIIQLKTGLENPFYRKLQVMA